MTKATLNIKIKLTLWYFIITATIIVLFSIAAYFMLNNGIDRVSVQPWNTRVAKVEKTTDNMIIVTGFSEAGTQEWNTQTNGVVKVFRFTKDKIVKSLSPEGTLNIENILISKNALNELQISVDDSISFYVISSNDETSIMAITQSMNNAGEVLREFRQVLFIIVPVTMSLLVIAGYFLVKRMLRPIQTITDTAQEIEEKNLSRRLEVRSNDELGKLSSTLNHMFERLENAFKRERQFTADASHELRTPLAIIQGESSLALREERSGEEYKKSLFSISQEAERMSSMLKKLLFLARSENHESQPDLENIDLKESLADLATDINVLCEEKSVDFELNAEDHLIVKGDKIKLRELFLNLLDNAIRYTPRGGNISLTLKQEDNKAHIVVKDTGIGIPKEHLPHIFERFYRVDKSRSRAEGGTGLGLSICQRIVELHGGAIEVESKFGEGSTFTVILPLIERN
jgi:heavy metal sensor kinase